MPETAPQVHLSLTIGPVQSFVAKARRTRDLWAGSWLLSHLAETALAVAEQAGGTAIIPHREDKVRERVTTHGKTEAGYPNRFELAFETSEQAKAAAEKAANAFRERWNSLAESVWQKFVGPVADAGNDTRQIWERQISHFWELSWVVSDSQGDSRLPGQLAAARKTFRNVPATAEPGVKCSLMGTLQEISGHFGRGSGSKQSEFWQRLRAQKGFHQLDLKQDERLCAVALVKRLFPRVVSQADGELRDQANWPSTAFLAALPWLRELHAAEGEVLEEAKAYAQAAKCGYDLSEHQTARAAGIPWAAIDGSAWFEVDVKHNEELNDDKIGELTRQLKNLYGAAGDRKPLPYYALLLMDGDKIGALLGQLAGPAKLSQGLHRFASSVAHIVECNDGRTVYAGGDDVMALLPAKSGLVAADELAKYYQECFPEIENREAATLSGTIVFAHWRHPMRQVMEMGHYLLDDIAKNRSGRNALAIGVILGSGLNALWSAPWPVVRGELQGEVQGCESLADAIDRFTGDDQDPEGPHFNASYLYLLRERLSRLLGQPLELPGRFGRLELDGEVILELAHAEYRRRMTKQQRVESQPDETRKKVEPLLALSRQWTRQDVGQGEFKIDCDEKTFGFDGWRTARFLKCVKEGKVDDHD